MQRVFSDFFKTVNLCDVGMIQASKDLSFTLESQQTIGIISEMIRQEFQRDITLQFGIKSTKHHTHAAFTQR